MIFSGFQEIPDAQFSDRQEPRDDGVGGEGLLEEQTVRGLGFRIQGLRLRVHCS